MLLILFLCYLLLNLNTFIIIFVGKYQKCSSISLIFYLIYKLANISTMNNDILHPSFQDQKNCHKLDRLIPTPDTYFMDVKCGSCL